MSLKVQVQMCQVPQLRTWSVVEHRYIEKPFQCCNKARTCIDGIPTCMKHARVLKRQQLNVAVLQRLCEEQESQLGLQSGQALQIAKLLSPYLKVLKHPVVLMDKSFSKLPEAPSTTLTRP